MPWKPSHPDEVPTLGWYVIDWITEYLATPGRDEYTPFIPYLEQEDFILRWYELNPETGRFRYQRGLLGRPRGWGKSPILAALAIVEGLADVVPAGWDANGQPVGRPWSSFRTPLVHIAAVSDDQTMWTWQPLLEMVRMGPVLDEYAVDPMDSFVALPRGAIKTITTAPTTEKGAPIVFATLDQTEEWMPNKGGPKFAQTIRTNAAKNGGRTLESPNAFIPGTGSVAEDSAAYAAAIKEGRVRDAALLYDHREAPGDVDLTDYDSLIHGLRVVYGDSSGHPDGCLLHDPPCEPGHVDLDSLVTLMWDPATDVQLARADFLNQITHASDSWLSKPEWMACRTEEQLQVGDVVTLGFDGSRARARGVTDATALVACRVPDGLLHPIRVWEQPDGPEGQGWRVPVAEVDQVIAETFRDYQVVGFYADPAKWETYIANWEAKYGAKLKVKATQSEPISWWMTGGRATATVRALDQFHSAVVDHELKHTGASVLMRHVLNARRRPSRSGMQIHKEHPDSPNKIDAAIAAVLAWQARLDAVSAGLGKPKTKARVRRIDRPVRR